MQFLILPKCECFISVLFRKFPQLTVMCVPVFDTSVGALARAAETGTHRKNERKSKAAKAAAKIG